MDKMKGKNKETSLFLEFIKLSMNDDAFAATDSDSEAIKLKIFKNLEEEEEEDFVILGVV